MRRGSINYFVREQIAPDTLEDELCEIPVRYVPMALEALETRKAPSFWTTPDDYARGYNALSAMQWGLLMGAREDIIREIRGARGGLNPAEPTDLTTHPVGTFPGWDLGAIGAQLNTGGQNVAQLQASANTLLTDIKAILEAQGEGEGGQLDALLKIVALLSV